MTDQKSDSKRFETQSRELLKRARQQVESLPSWKLSYDVQSELRKLAPPAPNSSPELGNFMRSSEEKTVSRTTDLGDQQRSFHLMSDEDQVKIPRVPLAPIVVDPLRMLPEVSIIGERVKGSSHITVTVVTDDDTDALLELAANLEREASKRHPNLTCTLRISLTPLTLSGTKILYKRSAWRR